jgi:Xaa-Pro aminopeptidase
VLVEGGFMRPAFEAIVASGPKGALPHARPGGRRLSKGDLIVLDFGGVYDGYCVDLTRTVGDMIGTRPS